MVLYHSQGHIEAGVDLLDFGPSAHDKLMLPCESNMHSMRYASKMLTRPLQMGRFGNLPA